MEYAGQPTKHCWCGNDQLKAYSADYLHCPACETLVIARMPDPTWLISPGDESGFYSRQYYEKFLIEEFGFPSLPERARTDLPERCLYWLRTLLRYRLPPGKALEVGSAHGAFVALLRWAGFDAVGLEVSPWLVEFARRAFDAPSLLGPIEEQGLEPGSFDIIGLLDVIEHFPDPAGSLRRCAEILRPDGLLLIQTPCLPEGKSHAQLVEENAPFLSTMVAPHHLFLFSRRSLTKLLREAGLSYVQFEPNLFPYDMFLVAARSPLALHPWEQVAQRLEETPGARLVRALLDLDDQLADLRRRYLEAEADRAARLEVIHRQGRQLGELDAVRNRLQQELHQAQVRLAVVDADRQALRQVLTRAEETLREAQRAHNELHQQIGQLQERSRAAEADRDQLKQQLDQLQTRLATADAERAQLAGQVGDLERELETARAERDTLRQMLDRAEQALSEAEHSRNEMDRQIGELLERSRAAEADRDQLKQQLDQLQTRLATADAERAQLADEIKELRRTLETTRAERDALSRSGDQLKDRLSNLEAQAARVSEEARRLKAQVGYTRDVLDRLNRSLVYRALRALHLWGWLAPAVESGVTPEAGGDKVPPASASLRRIAVDLTPLLPGGDNGGAKVMTLALIKQLSRLAPECEFLLLTSERSHGELAAMESANVRRLLVQRKEHFLLCLAERVAASVAPVLRRVAPRSVANCTEHLIHTVTSRHSGDLLRRLGADLLFCPFTAPFFYEPGIPVVSVVYDLQYLDYPQFFDATERSVRDRTFRQACLLASRLVCISDFVRQRVLRESGVPPDRVETIHITLPRRLSRPAEETILRILKRYQLEPERYLLYPANFWAHKNHELLLTAFGMYCARRPESRLRLVLTGAPGPRMEFVREAAQRMGIGARVVFPGFLPDEEFAALLHGCRALIFPSLYEGFGMPLLEAMAAGKPVLASNLTSLPEVAGDAAAWFDPRKPCEIVARIEQLEADGAWASELVRRGKQRLGELGDEVAMTAKYWKVFQAARADPAGSQTAVFGVYPDGWTGGRVVARFREGREGRRLVLNVRAPGWLPWPGVNLEVRASAGQTPDGSDVIFVARGETARIERVLPLTAGNVEICVSPVYQPKALGQGKDSRWLGCRVLSAQIEHSDGQTQPLELVPYGV